MPILTIQTLAHLELFHNGFSKESLSHMCSAPTVIKVVRHLNIRVKRCQLCVNVNNAQHVQRSALAMLLF
jgi:hypothetical protein